MAQNTIQFQGSSAALLHYISGALLSFRGVANLEVGTGQLANVTSTALITIHEPIEIDLIGLVGAGGLDAGVLVANSFYYVYAIAGTAVGVSAIASLSPSAPALPTGYTTYRRLDSFRTNGAAEVFWFTKTGTGRDRRTDFQVIDAVMALLNNGSATIETPVDCSSMLPQGSRRLIALLSLISDALVAGTAQIGLPNAVALGGVVELSGAAGSAELSQQILLATDDTQRIAYVVQGATAPELSIAARGYLETI